MGVGVCWSGAIQLVEVNDKPTQWASERTGRRRDPDPDPEQCVFSEACGGPGGDPWSPMTS